MLDLWSSPRAPDTPMPATRSPATAVPGRPLRNVPGREIAPRLGYRHPSSISAARRRVDAAMESRRFADRVHQLRQALPAFCDRHPLNI